MSRAGGRGIAGSAGDRKASAIASDRLLALVDALREGTLNTKQQETVYALRAALLRLTELPDTAA